MANLPEMLRAILVSALQGEADIEVLSQGEESQMLPTVGRFHPHVVIAGSDAPEACAPAPLELYLMRPDAGAIRRIELRSVSHDIGEVSLAELVASIHAIRRP